ILVLFLVSISIIIFIPFSNADINDYCNTPPFVTRSVTPNVLIILDNSNSMDEDFVGNAICSWATGCRSVEGRKALIDIINNYVNKTRLGLMSYRLSSASKYQLHNAVYFASYEPKSYCPNPPPECKEYCQTDSLTARSICETQCQAQNSSFDVDYMDEIIPYFSIGSEQRNRYCRLCYPKRNRYPNTTDPGNYVYYKKPGTLYAGSNYGTRFAYSTDYNPVEGNTDSYYGYSQKTGTSDAYEGYVDYKFHWGFKPTDEDWALGFGDFGRRLAWYYTGRTWFANSSPGDGYLHIACNDNDVSDTQKNALLAKLVTNENNESGYMSCTNTSNPNSCSYIVNAGLTPTAGTLQSSIDYLKGTGSYTSPIQYWCQKTFVVYVTDGLPSVNESGTAKSADELMPGVLNKLDALRNLTVSIGGTPYPLDVQTYILGAGLSDEAKVKLDDMAQHGGTDVGGHAYYADNPDELTEALSKIFTDILRRVSSGTAASILASSEKSGANILQAVFYPKQYFDSGTEAEWIGKLQNLWFYLGPFTQNIREDSDTNAVFNLGNDKVAEFFFDNSTGETKVNICTDSNGNGRIDGDENATCSTELLEDITPIWEAGKVLWNTAESNRYIFTDVSGLSNDPTKGNFITSNASTLQNYLDASNSTEASDIINYIRGIDTAEKRSRTVTIGSDTNVWKLGDIVYSTPKVVSSVPLNSYLEDYHDNTYRDFTSTTDYKKRGMVFVGANDGMLHAFRFGKLEFPETGSNIAKLTAPLEGVLGSEAWGFIPKNILPYLKYYMEPSYCHLAYVDLSPYAFDASIGEKSVGDISTEIKTENSWRTVLVGGLNFGGACGGNNTGAVHPPNETGNVTAGVGRSSYFAMDVTNPESPEIMWEFTDNNTAFTTTGPAIIHIPYKEGDGTINNDKNGYWYAAFASGPDDYNGTIHQPLYLYLLDLKTGTRERRIPLSGTAGSVLGSINAFAGRFFESQTDLGINYSDDVLYFGYNYYKEGNSWHGGILRLVTGNDHDVDSWEVSKLIGGGDIGPVTSGVTRLEDTGNHKLWVYFGEGRYFTADDDSDANRTIYGVKDSCYSSAGSMGVCTSDDTLSLSDLGNHTSDNPSNWTTGTDGWYINLDPSGGGYGAERVITDPVATTNGWVFYTTFMPTSDVCGFGGNTYIWMVDYETGGVPKNVGGVIFIQTSTGVIKKIELSKEFGTDKGTHGGRRLATPIAGAPSPSSGITVIVPPKPIKSLIQWRETPIRKGK
ncbi:MAG: hypothetical protein KAW82_04640, partial [Desulfurellaceae bacterium]|nr:hypothetical protein [Desulfurellaceae bacterium]